MSSLSDRIAALADPAEKQAGVEAADAAVADAEQRASEAEKIVQAARAAETALRPDLASARDALGALEAEARTIAKLLNAGDAGLFRGVIEALDKLVSASSMSASNRTTRS